MSESSKSQTVSGGGRSTTPQVAAYADKGPPKPIVEDAYVGGEARSRPVKPRGHFPERKMTWFQFNTSDLRALGAYNGVTTLFAAAGTYLMSVYLDYSKEMQMNGDAAGESFELLRSITNISLVSWIFCWIIAVLAFLIREVTLARIKEEHGVSPWWKYPWKRK